MLWFVCLNTSFIISISGILLIDKLPTIPSIVRLSPDVNFGTFLFCHFVKINFTTFINIWIKFQNSLSRQFRAKKVRKNRGLSNHKKVKYNNSVKQCLKLTDKAFDDMQKALEKQVMLSSRSLQVIRQLQEQMQAENLSYTQISNIMKTKHDTVKNSISNIR